MRPFFPSFMSHAIERVGFIVLYMPLHDALHSTHMEIHLCVDVKYMYIEMLSFGSVEKDV